MYNLAMLCFGTNVYRDLNKNRDMLVTNPMGFFQLRIAFSKTLTAQGPIPFKQFSNSSLQQGLEQHTAPCQQSHWSHNVCCESTAKIAWRPASHIVWLRGDTGASEKATLSTSMAQDTPKIVPLAQEAEGGGGGGLLKKRLRTSAMQLQIECKESIQKQEVESTKGKPRAPIR